MPIPNLYTFNKLLNIVVNWGLLGLKQQWATWDTLYSDLYSAVIVLCSQLSVACSNSSKGFKSLRTLKCIYASIWCVYCLRNNNKIVGTYIFTMLKALKSRGKSVFFYFGLKCDFGIHLWDSAAYIGKPIFSVWLVSSIEPKASWHQVLLWSELAWSKPPGDKCLAGDFCVECGEARITQPLTFKFCYQAAVCPEPK